MRHQEWKLCVVAAVVLAGLGCGVQQAQQELHATADPLEVRPLALGGPVILGGDDLHDHGSYNPTTRQLQQGWVYIWKALENIDNRVTRLNDGTVAVLGAADSTTTSANGGGAYHYAAPVAGLTPVFVNGSAAIDNYFVQLRAGAVQPAILVAIGTGVTNSLDSAEGAALTRAAVDIANFVNSGGGLLSHGAGPIAYGWLTTLIPGIREVLQCNSTTLSLTAAGQSSFPGLTNAHIRAGPCHSSFTQNLGGLLPLATDGNGRHAIIGGAAVQLPGNITLAPLTATYTIGVTSSHTVVATVRNGQALPVAGVTVTFRVDTGPNAGATGTGVTNATGQAPFTYSSNGTAGTDLITGRYVDGNETRISPAVQAIWELPANLPPVANAGGPYSTPEGSSVTLDGSASSDPDGNPLTYSWDTDNDGSYGDASGVTASFFGLDGPATHTVSLRVCDTFNACATASTTVTVHNVAPTANAGADQTVYRNDSVLLAGTWGDPAVFADDPYSWSWDLDGNGTADATGSAGFGSTIGQSTSFAAVGTYVLTFRVTDKDGGSGSDTVTITVLNRPPDCSVAAPSLSLLWPPNHRMVPISIQGVTDPDGDPVAITISSIRQDEPVNDIADGNTAIDGAGVGTDTAQVRAERSGSPRNPGNGRVYHIGFTASDGQDTCSGTVTVGVPHDQGGQPVPIDDGPLYDSTVP